MKAFNRASASLFASTCVALTYWGCAPAQSRTDRGRMLVSWYGCASCHVVPGVSPAGRVGPSLRGIGRRAFVAGKLPNTPDNLIQWIRYPHQVDENTAMPFMNVSEQDARDITAFLYTLR